MRLLLRDLRFGLRTLAKTPVFTCAVVSTLALGIGANTAVFTVTNALLLRPFPFRNPEQIVSILSKDAAKDNGGTLLRYELVRDYNRSFQSVAVWTSDNLNLTGSGEPLQVPVARISPTFFPTLDVQPQLGRVFTQEEGTPAGRPVVILTTRSGGPAITPIPTSLAPSLRSTPCPVRLSVCCRADARFPFMPKADVFTPRYFRAFSHDAATPEARRRIPQHPRAPPLWILHRECQRRTGSS